MQKITKKDIISSIFSQASVTREEVAEVLGLFVENLAQSLEEGKTVELRGLGTFLVRRRKGRTNVRNPHKPWEKTYISEHNVVFFRPGRRLRDGVWKLKGEEYYV